jgi:peptidoglycan/LPS O-acetylase OafA/YrhL
LLQRCQCRASLVSDVGWTMLKYLLSGLREKEPAIPELHINQKSSYRPDIEGLRGVAVCSVVAFHLLPKWFRGGFIGVDVFFVISGYLITGLLVREIEETGRLSLAGFYARRVRRLLPASALVLLATIMACALLLSPLQQYRLGDSGSHTALYISNFWFLRQASDYFAPAIASNPFLHTWSLAVEEQFYLVWPAIILLGLRGRRPRQTLFAIMILITTGSLAASVWFSGRIGPWAFFSPFSRAWEFAAGGIALLVAQQALQVSRSVRALAGWLGLASILAAAALLRGQAGWPGWLALIPVAGTAAVLLSRVPDRGASKILEFPVSQWLGRLSYSWYLWHWPLLAVLVAMHPELTRYQHLRDVLVCGVGSLGLAAATHAIVENPIRFSGYLARRRALSLAAAGLVTVITAGTAIAWQHSTSHEHGRILAAAQDARTIGACPPVGFDGSDVVECASGSPASEFAVVLFGDSHAGQWFPAFDAIASNRGWRLVLIRKPACPTARVASFNVFLNKPYTECDLWREAAIKQILEMHPAAVVIANRQVQSFSPDPRGPIDTWREGSRKTLETLDSAGIKTILLRDTPSPGLDIPDCLAGDLSWWARRHSHGNNPCTLNRAKALDPEVFGAEQEAVAGLRHVRMLDLSDLFCDATVCQPVKNGLIVYSDDSHISAPFARSLAPAVADRLVPLILSIR